jgi:AraC-like DNA-binding protein
MRGAGRLELVSVRPNLLKSPIDSLLTSLQVEVGVLAECLVSGGWRLSFPASQMPGLHYTVKGSGQIRIGDAPLISLVPHTLVITPPGRPYCFEAARRKEAAQTLKEKKGLMNFSAPGALQTFIAGNGESDVAIICGGFRAYYGQSINLFAAMSSPIVELFDTTEQLTRQLQLVLDELSARRIGMAAMTSALLKQVLLALLRRCLAAGSSRFEDLAVLNDVQIARSFAEMLAQPGAPHSIESLCSTAGLSRAAFIQRFTRGVGYSPIATLRELRMRRAAELLTADIDSVEKIARAVGYSSRSSFFRTFRQVYGTDPSAYRAARRQGLMDDIQRTAPSPASRSRRSPAKPPPGAKRCGRQ